MNWEGQVYGFANPNAQPPTPIPTPTSATGPGFSTTPYFPESPEATEFDPQIKWESSHHQEYLKAFFQSPLQQHQSFQQSLAPSPDSSHRPSSSASHKRHHSDPETQSIGLVSSARQRPGTSNLPVPPINHLSFSPIPSPTKRSRQLTPAKFSAYVDADRTVNSAGPIQTPPPSRTMNERSTRRKANKARLQINKGASGGAHENKRIPPLDTSPLDGYGPAEQEHRDLHQTFQSPQVSSQVLDMYGHPLPASAPAIPHKLFWDPSSEINGIGVSFAAGEHSLVDQNAHASDPNLDWGLGEQNTGPLGDQPSAATFSFLSDNRLSRSLVSNSEGFSESTAFEFSQVPLSHTSPDSYTYMPAISDGAVNPNLIFSFSTQPDPSYRVEHGGPEASRMQPYHHQTQELEREREFENARKARQQKSMNIHGRDSAGSSNPAVERTQHPSLKRSVSESVIINANRAKRPGQPLLANTREPNNDENIAPERRNSPLKKVGQQATLSSIPEKRHPQPRTTISFTIDNNGHAKAESKLVAEETEWETDVGVGIGHEEDSTESDTSTDSDTPDITSRKSSFTFPIGRSGRSERPKLARFNIAPLGRPNGNSNAATLPPSGSRSEDRSLYGPSEFSPILPSPSKGAPPFANGPNKGRTTNFRRQSGSSFGSSRLHGTDSFALQSFQDKEVASEAETVLEAEEGYDNGTAQHAIRQLIKRKQQKRAEEAASYPPPNKKALRAPKMFSPSSILRHQETSQRQPNRTYSDTLNISPTTVTDPDIATPSTDHGGRDNGETRCVCRSGDFEGLMILCDSCNKWLHARCVGLKEKSLPNVYVCNYCIGQTPVTRGGRVRAPRRANTDLPSSPLAHKTNKSNRR